MAAKLQHQTRSTARSTTARTTRCPSFPTLSMTVVPAAAASVTTCDAPSDAACRAGTAYQQHERNIMAIESVADAAVEASSACSSAAHGRDAGARGGGVGVAAYNATVARKR